MVVYGADDDGFQSEMVMKTHLDIPVTGWGLGVWSYFIKLDLVVFQLTF